jgi:hypothetical protein
MPCFQHAMVWSIVLATVAAASPAEEPAVAVEGRQPSDPKGRQPLDQEGLDLFEKKIRPILVERCYECHSGESKKVEGSLLVDSQAGLLKGGDLGAAIVPGDPDASLLIQAIRYRDKNLQMPPDERLAPETIADFEAWVKRGAPDPRSESPLAGKYVVDFEAAKSRWPYTPPVEPAIPAVKDESWAWNPIDRFLLARLEAAELAPAADADPRTLIRRVTYDLTGLPPTVEETDAFVRRIEQDGDRRQAFAELVERLLESPHYGERWGRHWLDVVRYADTAGDNSDYPIPQMYRYRNWVIDAINADLPFDRFIREQLAGDLLPADSDEARYRQTIATGYLANARRFGSRVDDYPQHLTIEDTIDNLGRAFLGHSLSCARCHNHKFDPFTAEDYYAIYGIFHSTQYPWPGIELDKRQRHLVPLASSEQVAMVQAERKEREAELNKEVKAAEEACKEADGLLKMSQETLEKFRQDEKTTPEDLRAAESALAEAEKRVKEREQALQQAKRKRDEFQASPLPYDLAYAVAEGKKIEDCTVQLKGDPTRPGKLVPRRFPVVLGGHELPDGEHGSGRVELADWIASPDNPLTARVMVNRIWQHHFGRGIVPTPNDFGKQGQPATHPELLDWLALRFIESGWSLKAMHRLVLSSHAYQMASHQPASGESAVDPNVVDAANSLLWHFPRRRLDAESIRDTLLAVGGNLDRSPGGEHPFPPQKDWGFTQHKPFKAVYDTNRRSVYLMTQRIQRHPFLAIFDGPDTAASTASRVTSTTTLQALYFLNDPFVHDQARRLTEQLAKGKPTDAERIDLAYRTLLARPPTAEELTLGQEYLAKRTEQQDPAPWESYVRALLRTNEFVYLN